jgi:hypothetical protein
MANLYDQSNIWFFWLNTNTASAILQFAALADSSAVNSVAGPGATYSFTCDADKHLFIVVAVNGNYIIKSIAGRDVTLTAGTGTSITGGPAYVVNSFSGQSITSGAATTASTAALYLGVTTANTTEANVSPWIATRAGTISQLYVKTSTNLAVATNTLVATVRKNGADTTLTCTVANGTNSANDTVHSFTVVAGDQITAKSVQTATGEVTQLAIAVTFRPSVV